MTVPEGHDTFQSIVASDIKNKYKGFSMSSPLLKYLRKH